MFGSGHTLLYLDIGCQIVDALLQPVALVVGQGVLGAAVLLVVALADNYGLLERALESLVDHLTEQLLLCELANPANSVARDRVDCNTSGAPNRLDLQLAATVPLKPLK